MRRVHALVSCQDRSSSCTAQARYPRAPWVVGYRLRPCARRGSAAHARLWRAPPCSDNMCALPLDGTSALALSPMHRVCPCTASTHTRLPRPLSPELSSKIVGVKTRIHPAKSIAGVGRHAADVAAAIVEDARAAARAAAAAREAEEAEMRRRATRPRGDDTVAIPWTPRHTTHAGGRRRRRRGARVDTRRGYGA